MFQEVASGVYAVYNRFVEGKAGIVVGSHGALALDACNYADEGASMAAFIREQGFPVDRLALTHGHGDHILGADAFVGAQIIAQITTPQVIERQVEGWANRWLKEPMAPPATFTTSPSRTWRPASSSLNPSYSRCRRKRPLSVRARLLLRSCRRGGRFTLSLLKTHPRIRPGEEHIGQKIA